MGQSAAAATVAAALLLQFAGLYLPPLRDLLHTQPLTLTDLLVVFAASSLGYAAMRLEPEPVRREERVRTGF